MADQRKKQNGEIQDGHGKTGTNGSQFNSDDEPDWMREFVASKDHHIRENNSKKKEFGVGLERHHKKGCKDNYQNLFPQEEEDHCNMREQKNMKASKDSLEMDDQEFLVEDYESDDEGTLISGKSKRKVNEVSISSSSDDEEEQDESNEEEKLKVYFCSRTHSQLSQFIKELRKTIFANELNVICLGSRKNFCINEGICIDFGLLCLCVFVFLTLSNTCFRGAQTW